MNDSDVSFSCRDWNLSRDSVSEEVWSIRSVGRQYESTSLGVSAALIVLFVIGVPWNLIVIVIILKKHLYHNPSVLLLLNITVTDLMVCLVIKPMLIVPGLAGDFIFGNSDSVRCQVCMYDVIIFLTLIMQSIFTLLLSTIDRLIYLKKPLRYKSLITPKKILILLPFVLLASLLLSLPPLFGEIGYGSFGVCLMEFDDSNLTATSSIYIILLMVVLVSSVVGTIIGTIWALCIARKHIFKRHHESMESIDTAINREKENISLKQKFVVYRIFIAIIVTNIIGWLPFFVSVIARFSIEGDSIHPAFDGVAFVMILSQPVVHPILQVFLVGKVRNAMRECLKFMLMCRRNRKKHSSNQTQSA